MKAIIDIFRMKELSIETRISIIKELGFCVNHEYGANVTEKLVVELVMALDPNNGIRGEKHYEHFLHGTTKPSQ